MLEPKIQVIYNKNVATIALIGIIASFLLAFQEESFSPKPVYGYIIFTVIMLAGYFLTNIFFYEQDPPLLILSCFIVELGLVMLYRIDPTSAFRQLHWFGIGITLFFVCSLLSKLWIEIKVSPFYFFAVTAILLVSPLIFGVERWGSKSWIVFQDFSFQPSELAKITFGLFLAGSLNDGKIKKPLLFLGQLIIILGFLVIARDLGGAMLFYSIALVVIFVATSRWDIMSFGILGAGIVSFFSYKYFGHIRVRVSAWLNPWEDVPGKGYQIVQSLFAMAEGGFFGTGLGLGRPDYIPAVTTDFIFSAFFEEFGFLGATGLIVLYFLLVYRGIKISLKAKSNFLILSALSITVFFGIQIFAIIGGVIKLIPMTGVTLPFMSYGGSSMVISFISLGILNGIKMKDSGGETDAETSQ